MGWNATAWDPDNYRGLYDRLTDIYAATMERRNALLDISSSWVYQPSDYFAWVPLVDNYRGMYDHFTFMKLYIWDLWSTYPWIDEVIFDGSEANLKTWLDANVLLDIDSDSYQWNSTIFPVTQDRYIDHTTCQPWLDFCAKYDVPTNYFDYTPYRRSDSSDIETGFTAEDYWEVTLKEKILPNMVRTCGSYNTGIGWPWLVWSANNMVNTPRLNRWNRVYEDDWATAKTNGEWNFLNDPDTGDYVFGWGSTEPTMLYGGEYSPPNVADPKYIPYIHNRAMQIAFYFYRNQYFTGTARVRFFSYLSSYYDNYLADIISVHSGGVTANARFEVSNEMGYTTDEFNYVGSGSDVTFDGSTVGFYHYSANVGSDSATFIPSACSSPTADPDNYDYVLKGISYERESGGWIGCLIDYKNTANGFQYV